MLFNTCEMAVCQDHSKVTHTHFEACHNEDRGGANIDDSLGEEAGDQLSVEILHRYMPTVKKPSENLIIKQIQLQKHM